MPIPDSYQNIHSILNIVHASTRKGQLVINYNIQKDGRVRLLD